MKLTLSDLTSLTNESSATAAINANGTLIEAALENTLSLDGTIPNHMSADLDLNGNRILNLPDALTDQEPVTLGQLDDVLTSSGIETNAATFLTLSTNSILPNERVLTAGTGVIFTDGGAGSTLTVNTTAISASALTRTNDTNVILTLGGAPTTSLLAATSLTLGWTGTLGAARGGFGADVSAATGIPLFAAGTPTFTSTTGTGNIARATSPTFVTPALGSATGTKLVLTVNTTNAFVVGSAGTTNPAFVVDSTTGDTTGVKIVGSPGGTGVGAQLFAISSAANENFLIDAVGTGAIILNGTAGNITLGASAATVSVGGTMSVGGKLSTTASSTSRAGLRIQSGTAPTSPVSGDFWYDGTNLKFRDGSTTRTLTWT